MAGIYVYVNALKLYGLSFISRPFEHVMIMRNILNDQNEENVNSVD